MILILDSKLSGPIGATYKALIYTPRVGGINAECHRYLAHLIDLPVRDIHHSPCCGSTQKRLLQ